MKTELSMTPAEIAVCERLRHLKMSGMADEFEKQLADPNADLSSFFERFSAIVNTEWQEGFDGSKGDYCRVYWCNARGDFLHLRRK